MLTRVVEAWRHFGHETSSTTTANSSEQVSSISMFSLHVPLTDEKSIVLQSPLCITCSAVILCADWSIGVRPGAVHTS